VVVQVAAAILDRVDAAGIGDMFAVIAILLCCREIRNATGPAARAGPHRQARRLAVHRQRVRVLLRDAG
jgi:hypothetical protein